jgi:hypothetical protein
MRFMRQVNRMSAGPDSLGEKLQSSPYNKYAF